MNENIDLCKILKGHEGETFYSPAFGYVKLEDINCLNVRECPIKTRTSCGIAAYFSKEGKYEISENSECILFPSKEQRDWNNWMEEQKSKVPKTWSEIVDNSIKTDNTNHKHSKSVLAFMKLYQLIEAGYGGNPSTEYKLNLNNTVYVPDYWPNEKKWSVCAAHNSIDQIAFYKEEQAEEFLSYPENIQLLEEFYML